MESAVLSWSTAGYRATAWRAAPAEPEAAACAQRSVLPWQGPARCQGGALLRPASRRCTLFRNVTPRIDAHGVYRAERDPHNWVQPVDGGVLELLAMYVVENGEHDTWPHGPYGNLYWDVFEPSEPLDPSPDGAHRRRITGPRVLRGPHRTHGRTDEWLDDEALAFRGAGLLRWGQQPGTSEHVVLRIWESDWRSEDGVLGRRNDVLGMERISRRATQCPCGVWQAFHRYTNAHPRRRTDQVAVWLKLRTLERP